MIDLDYMEDKIYLFTIKDKNGKISKYATAQLSQFEAEVLWNDEISNDHDNINYTVKEITDEVSDDVIWF